MQSAGWKLIEKTDGHLVGTFNNVFVSAWWAPANIEQLRALPAQREEIERLYPGGYGNLALLGPGAGKVSAEVRAEGERMSKMPAPLVRATAQVIEGTGFGAAAVRSVAAAIMALNRSPAPSKIFDSLPPGAAWLMMRLGTPNDTAKLVEAVRAARPQMV